MKRRRKKRIEGIKKKLGLLDLSVGLAAAEK
jgi:hypothetical protein